MLIIGILYFTVLLKYIKAQGGAVPDNVTQIRYGRINVHDQISYDLNEIFRSAKRDKKEFKLNNKASRITSSDPFMIMEFQANCTNLNRAYRGQGIYSFSAICAQNELHEVKTKEQDKSIVSTREILKVDANLIKGDQYKEFFCKNSAWSSELNIYALVCDSPPISQGNPGYVHIMTVSRNAAQGTSSMLDHRSLPKSQRIDFTNKTIVKKTNFPKGTVFASDTQFLAFDEPWIDQNGRVASKGNLFFLIWSVTPDKKIHKEVQIINFLEQTANCGLPLMGEMYKLVSVEDIGGKLIIAAYFNQRIEVEVVMCDVETNIALSLKNCRLLRSNYKTEIGMIQFWQTNDMKQKRVTSYVRKTKEIKVCDFDPNPTASSFQINCATTYSRATIVKDIAFGWFDGCELDFCNTVYFDQATKNFIGVDEWKYTNSADVSGKKKLMLSLNNRFKSFGATGRVLGNRFYMADNKYIIGFNDTRSEEAVIRASLLPPGENFYVTFFKDQAKTHEFINITGYRVKKMIFQITAKLAFPKFRGSLKQMYRVPLGRQYINGNKLQFKLQAQSDILQYSHIHYSSAAEVSLKGEKNNHNSFLIGKGTSSIVTSGGKLVIAACYRTLIKNKTGLDCEKIVEKAQALPKDEHIISQFVTNSLHLMITNKGNAYTYWKRNGKKIQNFYNYNKNLTEATFKVYKGYILIATMSTDGEISIKAVNQFVENGAIIGIGNPINKALFDKNQFNFKNHDQVNAGEFCPKGLRFSLIDRPILIIVNSCKGKDRRLFYFVVTESGYQFARNNFIRKVELDYENLRICPDLEMNFVAAIGTKHAYGIGLRTHNFFQDMGLHEMNVTTIQEMVCIGTRVIGLVVKDTKNRLSVVTYFLGKMKDADNRVHSQYFLPGVNASLVRVEASESEGLIFYNVITDKSKGNIIFALDIDGPTVFFKSMSRQVAYETSIAAGNGNENQNFDILVEFEVTKHKGSISSKNQTFKIEKKKYSVENISYFHGPIFRVRSTGKKAFITQHRLSIGEELIKSANELKLSSVDSVGSIGGRVYSLAQGPGQSKILISDSKGSKIWELPLNRRCESLRIVNDLRDSPVRRVIGVTNCFVPYKGLSGEILPPQVITYNRYPTILEIDPTPATGPVLLQCNNAKDWPFYSLQGDVAYLGAMQKNRKANSTLPVLGEKDFLAVLVNQRNHTMMFRWFTASEQGGDRQVSLNPFFREEGGKPITP